MEMSDDRHVRCDSGGGLVDRREVVEVQDVVVRGAGAVERPGPGRDVALVLVVVDSGEDAVRRVRAVLEGRMHRRVARGEVDRPDVEAGVEAARVAEAVAAERAGDDRDVPALGGQGVGERARHVGGAAAGEEHQGIEDTHRSGVPEVGATGDRAA